MYYFICVFTTCIHNILEFYSTCDLYNNQLDCKMNEADGCLNQWSKQYWELTNSRDIPMGLVFDQRWEGKIFAFLKELLLFTISYNRKIRK